MDSPPNKDTEFFEHQFTAYVDMVKSEWQLLHAYDGVLNPETITKIEIDIEEKILNQNLTKTVVKKVFFICIEALQNMYIHGNKGENKVKHNFFLLFRTDRHIKMVGANIIQNSSIEKLKTHITRINSFDTNAELKAYYLEHLENNEISEKGGAGLGFITIGMKSGNKLHSEFKTINDLYSMFLMEVTIDIEQ